MEHEYLLPLDGQTIDGTKYKRLVDYLGTATLPNINGRYLRADSTPGQMVEAGLPNITGTFKLCGAIKGGLDNHWGAFYNGGVTYGGAALMNKEGFPNGYEQSGEGSFDASRSSSIYGKSTTVTPSTYTVRAYICYA